MSLFRNLFGRRSRRFGRFGGIGRRTNALAHSRGGRRGGMALGIMALIAPFIVRKLRMRQAQRGGAGYGAAY